MIWSDDPVERLHQQMWEWSRRARFVPIERALDARRVLANEVEANVAARLEAMGFYVATTTHKAHWDLLACRDAGALRVEVKASIWHKNRYQFQLRDNQADALVLCCRDGMDNFFVIPFDQVAGITYIKITSHDPCDYVGRWMGYIEAWELFDDMAGVNAWQMPLI